MCNSRIWLSHGFDVEFDPFLLVSQVPMKFKKNSQLRKGSLEEVKLKLTHLEGLLSQHHILSKLKFAVSIYL